LCFTAPVLYFNSDLGACLSPKRTANGTTVCYRYQTSELEEPDIYNITLIASKKEFRSMLYGPYVIYPYSQGNYSFLNIAVSFGIICIFYLIHQCPTYLFIFVILIITGEYSSMLRGNSYFCVQVYTWTC